MTEKTQYGNQGNPVDCSSFDAHLNELMDGTLQSAELVNFEAHAETCTVCGPLFTLAKEGREWMNRLEEIEPPAHLVHNILAKTSLVETGTSRARVKVEKSWLRKWSDYLSPQLAPTMFRMMQPRIAMTFAAAFFSISLGLNMAGVKIADLEHMVTDPGSITNSASIRYYETTARVVKYYENIRFVYEIQTRIQQLKNATTDKSKQDDKKNDKNNKKAPESPDNTSETPKQNRNYNLNRDADVLTAVRPASLNLIRDNTSLS